MDTEAIKDLDTEEMMTLARRYYATRFLNPQRLGCPPPGETTKVVSRRRAPDQALREHLFKCSECFGEYRQALAQCQLAPDEVAGRKRLVSIFTLKRSAAILILSTLFFADRLIWRRPVSEARNEQITPPVPSGARAGAGGAGESDPSRTAKRSLAVVVRPPVNRRAMGRALRSSNIPEPSAETIDVDLNNFLVSRRSDREKTTTVSEDPSGKEGEKTPGASDKAPLGEKVITLPATVANLVLRLPETGVPGKYNVSLINASGRPLLSNSAFSPDGAKLRVRFDLRRVAPKKYRLRLWRIGEAPAFYDVVISAHWTLLLLREFFLGSRRFEILQAHTGMSSRALSDRLQRLQRLGIITAITYQERPLRYEYHLTDKGLELCPVIVSMTRWGDRWMRAKGESPPARLAHKDCGHAFNPVLTCASCGQVAGARDVGVEIGPEMKAERTMMRDEFFAAVGRKPKARPVSRRRGLS